MRSVAPAVLGMRSRRILTLFGSAALAMASPACSGGPPPLPEPRPIVVRSGVRIYPEKERLQEIDTWYRAEEENIRTDPGFFIKVVDRDTPSYPWESLLIHGDTAEIGVDMRESPEAGQVYEVYAHLHLMKVLGRLGEFLPEYADAEGFPLERAILSRVSDVWMLARGVYDAAAYEALDEILYSNENGYLDAMILTARGKDFPQERQAWLQDDPEGLEKYRQWFQETFSREPPGLRGSEGG